MGTILVIVLLLWALIILAYDEEEIKEDKIMVLSNKAYEILRWVVITVIPALLVFYGVLGNTLNIPYTETVLTIGAAFDTLLGTIFGISKLVYDKSQKG